MRTGCLLTSHHKQEMGFPDSSVGKDSACNAGDLGLIPGLGRSSGEGNGYLLQYSCLGNPTDREAWWATVHRVINESDPTKHRPYNQEKYFPKMKLSTFIMFTKWKWLTEKSEAHMYVGCLQEITCESEYLCYGPTAVINKLYNLGLAD